MPHFTFRSEYVRCGRNCTGCPHGPYWYGYWREDGVLRKRYFGKQDPRPQPGRPCGPPGYAWERIFDRRKASVPLACEILGIDEATGRDAAYKAYRRRMAETHPDVGGNVRDCQAVNAAWSFLKAARGW